MGLELTDEEIQDIGYLKGALTEYLKLNLQNFDFQDFSNYAAELLTKVADNIGFKMLSYDVDEQLLRGTIAFVDEENKPLKNVDFEIRAHIDMSEFEKQMKDQVAECEPWRLSNPKLGEHEDHLREACNNIEKYEPSPLFDETSFWNPVNLMGAGMCIIGLFMVYRIIQYSIS
jgi:hypothetical protein